MPTNVELTTMIIDLQNRVCDLEEEMKVIKRNTGEPVNAVIDEYLYWVKNGSGVWSIATIAAVKVVRQRFNMGFNEAVNAIRAYQDTWEQFHPRPRE